MLPELKLIVSEVDGVLTDGKLYIDELTNTPMKAFSAVSLETVNLIKRKLPIVFISNDNSISYNFFRKKNIPFYWAKRDKEKVLGKILRSYSVTSDDVLYIATKPSDIRCANMIPFTVCPADVFYFFNPSVQQLNAKLSEQVLAEVYVRFIR